MLKEGENYFRNITLDDFRSVQEGSLYSVFVEGADISSNRLYEFGFITEHPHGPYVKIDTKQRKTFLESGTEQQAQDSLIDLVNKVRHRTGGYFEVHPFYGAVYGTKLTTVSPDFLTDLKGSDERLSMIIYLTNNGLDFDSRLTHEYQAIGTSFNVPSAQSERYLEYLRGTHGGNPNQKNRDQAIANGLQEGWGKEFEKFNGGKIRRAMRISPKNVVDLMGSMRNVGIVNTKVSRLFLK